MTTDSLVGTPRPFALIAADEPDYHALAAVLSEHGCASARADAGERKRTEQRLNLLTTAIDHVREAIFLIAEDAHIRYANKEACRGLGYTRDELLDISLNGIEQTINADIWRTLWAQLLKGHRLTLEGTHTRKDGSTFPVEVVANLIEFEDRPYSLCFVRDISERKRTERELRLLNHALDQSTEVAYMMNGQGRFVYVNDAACRTLGYSRAELLQMGPLDIDVDVPPEIFRVMLNDVMTKGPSRGIIESRQRRRDGHIFPVELSTSIVDVEGTRHILTLARDITERKNAERRLRESYELLQDLSARRDSAREEEKTRIAREIHDELGQLLTALRMGLGAAELEFGASHPMLKERIRHLTDMADNTIRVVRHVATSLRPSALDSGLIPAIQWLIGEFQRHADVTCTLDCQTPLPDLDDYRAVALFRIVQESLTNVARHAQARNVIVSLAHGNGTCRLEIRDDGLGFDPEARRDRSFGLTGMRERVLMLRGDIIIESRPGAGTTIKLSVPDSNKRQTP